MCTNIFKESIGILSGIVFLRVRKAIKRKSLVKSTNTGSQFLIYNFEILKNKQTAMETETFYVTDLVARLDPKESGFLRVSL